MPTPLDPADFNPLLPQRPYHVSHRPREEWEIAFAMGIEAFNAILAQELWQRLVGINRSFPSLNPEAHVVINFGCPNISIRKGFIDLMLPFADSTVSFPGYSASYKGAALVLTASLDTVDMDVRWVAENRAQFLLRLAPLLVRPSLQLVQYPKADTVAARLADLIFHNGNLAREVFERVVQDGSVLFDRILTDAEVARLNQLQPMIPSRICLDFLCKQPPDVHHDTVLARIVCSGKYVAREIDVAFASTENAFLLLSNQMTMSGVIIPAVTNLLRNFNASLAADYLRQDGMKLGWKPEGYFQFDDFLQLANRPSIKAMGMDKGFLRMAQACENYGLKIALQMRPEFELLNHRLTLNLNVTCRVDYSLESVQLGSFTIKAGLHSQWDIAFFNDGLTNVFQFTPHHLHPTFSCEDTSSKFEKIMRDVVLTELLLVVIAIGSLGCVGELIVTAFVSVIAYLWYELRPIFHTDQGASNDDERMRALATLAGRTEQNPDFPRLGASYTAMLAVMRDYFGGPADIHDKLTAMYQLLDGINEHTSDMSVVLAAINTSPIFATKPKPYTMDDLIFRVPMNMPPSDRIVSVDGKDILHVSACYKPTSPPQPPPPV